MNTTPPEMAHRSNPSETIPIDRQQAAKNVRWMRELIALQLQCFRTNTYPPSMILAKIRPEHEGPMLDLDRTLLALEEALRSNTDPHELYRQAVDQTIVSKLSSEGNTTPDPRVNYWQILSWYAAFKCLRETTQT